MKWVCFLAVAHYAYPLGAQTEAEPPKKVLSVGVSKTRNLSPFHAVEKLDLGNFNLYHGNTRQAINAYRTAIQINPELWEAHWGLANCYVRRKQADSAIQECLRVLELKPRHKNATMLLASLYKAKGKFDLAILWFEKSRTLGVNSAELYTGLGLTQVQSGLLSEGKVNLKKALELSKKQINARANLGLAVIAYKEGDKEQAMSLLDLSIKQQGGRFTEARSFRANILLSTGKKEEAKKEYHAIIANEDPVPENFQALGNIYLNEQKLDEAFKIFLQGSKWFPEDSDILLGLAVVLERQNRMKESILAYRAAINRLKESDKKAQWKKHLNELELLMSKRAGGANK